MTLLHIWLIAVTTVGAGVNYALARCLLKNLALSMRPICTGVTAALATHVVVMVAIIGIAKGTYRVSRGELEELGYFLGPLVLAAVAVPTGILACWYESTARNDKTRSVRDSQIQGMEGPVAPNSTPDWSEL
jgi:hypothetical protein